MLSGPKVLCNACGVKVLYPMKSRKPKPDAFLFPTSHCPQQSGVEKHSALYQNGTNGFCNAKRAHPQSAEGSSRQQPHYTAANKRQRTGSPASDLKLSPTQKQYLEVERRYDATGRHVVEWTVTDCTIDDSRDFQQLGHAQAFMDECWAFISADLR